MEFITLAEVLHHIDTKSEPFDIEVVTADVKRGTGGELKAYASCVKDSRQGVKSSTKQQPVASAAPKNPNHQYHSTRNLYLTKTGEVRKVHVRLITLFNGKVVS